MTPIILGLAPFVIFPALVFLFVSARVRRIAILAASLAALLSVWLVDGGPEDPGHLLSLITFGIAAGAVLIEFAALLRTIAKGKRTAHG